MSFFSDVIGSPETEIGTIPDTINSYNAKHVTDVPEIYDCRQCRNL